MTLRKRIRVLIVDDSVVFRTALSRSISADPAIEVAGTAADPFEARDKILSLAPDVMTLDVSMPRMDGIAFLKKLMPQYPLPVVVVSSASGAVLDALNAGAVDFVAKPEGGSPEALRAFFSELAVKIKIASIAKIGIRRQEAPISSENRASPGGAGARNRENALIAIGASTGGTEAVASVIRVLSADTPGIAIVQHMPTPFTRMFAERLDGISAMEVREARDGDEMRTGCVLIAPGDRQMELRRGAGGFYVHCFEGEKVNGHRPSVEVLFKSFAACAKPPMVGVILTGMGGDGAKGLLEMRQHGAFTIGQDEKSCVVYGMPHVAMEVGAVCKQASLDAIPGLIQRYLDGREA